MKKNKFKVGDLVTLSAAGAKMSQNWRYRGGFGIVTDAGNHYADSYPIACFWQTTREGWSHKGAAYFKTYELKFVKPDKKCPRQSD
mgnify:CR=1 FL=1